MKTKEIKIAITAILAIIIIYFGIVFLKGLKLFSTDNIYYVEMKDVGGLNNADIVVSNGMNIGMVKNITYNAMKQTLYVAIELNEGFTLTKGSHANITKEMLGSPKLNIILGTNPHDMLHTGDTIPGNAGTDLMTAGADMIPHIQALMPKLDSIATAINMLINDTALINSLHDMQYISHNLRTTTDNVNDLLAKDMPRLIHKADGLMDNLAITTSKINDIDIAAVANNANMTLNNANKTMEQLNGITHQLSNPNSSIGKLMNDPDLYNNLDSTMYNASKLLEDLRLNPKRYVHFSLFGKKAN